MPVMHIVELSDFQEELKVKIQKQVMMDMIKRLLRCTKEKNNCGNCIVLLC